MDRLRTPFLVVAVIALFLAVLVETSSAAFLTRATGEALKAPGIGIAMTALMDGIVLFNFIMVLMAVVIPPRVMGVLQGIVTFVVMLLTLLGGIAALLYAIGLLILMVTLLTAVPIGTIAYMAAYVPFASGAAAATISVILFLKVLALVMIFIAQQRFLQVKSLVFLLACSFLVTFVVSLCHSLAPGPVDSIADAVGGIVAGVIALIWALVKLIGAIPGIVKGLRLDRHVA
ncbi:MAG: hypothetical protein AAFU65_09585 [Pseudomonadota bacterium]